MDKYQKLLVQKARIKEWLYFENNGVSDEESSKYWKRVVFDENNDTLTIIQDENPPADSRFYLRSGWRIPLRIKKSIGFISWVRSATVARSISPHPICSHISAQVRLN